MGSGPGRCFPFWQEMLACYVVNTSPGDDSGKSKCAPALEDYYECLHHRKEVSDTTAAKYALYSQLTDIAGYTGDEGESITSSISKVRGGEWKGRRAGRWANTEPRSAG